MRGGRVTAPAALRDSARQRSAGLRPAIRVERSGDGGTSPDKSESRRLGPVGPHPRTARRFRAGLPKCGESRTETPEQEGLGSGDPTPSRSWLGNRNSLARLRRAAASSDWSLLICERGGPFHTFPPVTQAATEFAAIVFCPLGSTPPRQKSAGTAWNADLWAVLPGGARHSWPQASGRRIAAPPHDAARQRQRHSCRWHRPPGNAGPPVGTAGRRPAGGASLLPRMAPQGKDTAIRADGTGRRGTPDLRSAQLAAGQRAAHRCSPA